jgi:phosphoribosyl 1,2-cyclic phosphate phosphodiesterase
MYASARTLQELRTTFRYAFGEAEQMGGGVPSVTTTEIHPGVSFTADGVEVLPILVMHGVLPVLGFRIGNMAYVTDTNMIPDEALEQLQGLDLLVLDALRLRPHPTHFSLEEAVETARVIGAKRTFFTHIAHNIHHERDSAGLPDGMHFAFDGLRVSSPLGSTQ